MSSGKWRPFCLGLNVLNTGHGVVAVTKMSTRVTCDIAKYDYFASDRRKHHMFNDLSLSAKVDGDNVYNIYKYVNEPLVR